MVKEAVTAAKKGAAKYATKGDSVCWDAVRENGTHLGNWKSNACYASALSTQCGLGGLEIHCKPMNGPGKSPMPGKDFQEFFRLCQEVGMVPTGVKATTKDKANLLTIPRNGWDRHTLYITLCYYRQCDIRPSEIMTALGLWKHLEPKGTTFLQILHYLAATSTISCGHTFMNLSPYGGGNKLDLGPGAALTWFAGLSKAQRAKTDKSLTSKDRSFSSGNYTETMLAEKAKTFSVGKVTDVSGILEPKNATHYALEPGKQRIVKRILQKVAKVAAKKRTGTAVKKAEVEKCQKPRAKKKTQRRFGDAVIARRR